MSGHSKWSTIKRQKAVTDAKRGAVFTKLGNQIAIAARGGTDPAMNSSLAMAIEKAKAANRRHLQSEKGKAKGRIASYNYYDKDEDFLQKKREAAKLYDNNASYRLHRQAKAKERYHWKMNHRIPPTTESTESTESI